MRVGASSSPSMTGLRHYRSGCVPIPCAGPPTTAATRPTTHARAGPTPIRRFGVDDFEAHDPRQRRSDTSPPISQATARPPIGRCREATRPIFLRETETGTKLSLLNAPTPKPGQNSPCTGKTARIPRFWASRGNFVTEMPQRPCAWRILSRTCPEVRALGEFCPGRRSEAATPGTFYPAISCTLAR